MRLYCTTCEQEQDFYPPTLPWGYFETVEDIWTCGACGSEAVPAERLAPGNTSGAQDA